MFPGGYCAGLGVGGWLLMIGFWGVLIAVVVWAVTRLFPSTPIRGMPGDDALVDNGLASDVNLPDTHADTSAPAKAARAPVRR